MVHTSCSDEAAEGRVPSSRHRSSTGSPMPFSSRSFAKYSSRLASSPSSYIQSSSSSSLFPKAARSSSLMYFPSWSYSLLRIPRMYPSSSLRLALVSSSKASMRRISFSASTYSASVVLGSAPAMLLWTGTSCRLIFFFVLGASSASMGCASAAPAPAASASGAGAAAAAASASLPPTGAAASSIGVSASFFSSTGTSYSSRTCAPSTRTTPWMSRATLTLSLALPSSAPSGTVNGPTLKLPIWLLPLLPAGSFWGSA
mmetsp:Transcript_4019/g.11228  ORF Transcript_4019/g.11228 Transcript_4019/m.11228 type:complete len:258 (+) Transcript_4019:530-1303(+)